MPRGEGKTSIIIIIITVTIAIAHPSSSSSASSAASSLSISIIIVIIVAIISIIIISSIIISIIVIVIIIIIVRARRLLDIAATVPVLREGATTSELRAFCEGVVGAVRDGLNINAKGTKGYTYKTVARKVLTVMAVPKDMRRSASGDMRLSASCDDGGTWDDVCMAELLSWMPDQEDYLKPLEVLSCAEARRLFAMPPPWISCFACYMGTLSKPQVVVLQKAKGIDILTAVEKFKKQRDFAPSIMSVASMLMEPR